MDEYQILSLLQKYSVEILILAFVDFAVAAIIKKFAANLQTKAVVIIQFGVGFILYAVYARIFMGAEADIFGKGSQVGGVSVLLSSLLSKVTDGDFLQSVFTREGLEKIIKTVTGGEKVDKGEIKAYILSLSIEGLTEKEVDEIAELIVKLSENDDR